MKKTVFLSLLISFFLSGTVNADVALYVINNNNELRPVPELVCTDLQQNLYVGLYDYMTYGNAVTQLQEFLASTGHLDAQYRTGYFGGLTRQAVIAYQKSERVDTTGYVGPLTRAEIKKSSCPNGKTYFNEGLELNSISRSYGSIGDQVKLTGSGFDRYANTVVFGSIAISNVPSYDGKTITFIVPETSISCPPNTTGGCTIDRLPIPAGNQYQVYVITPRGTTSAKTFSLRTQSETAVRPSISSIYGPETLRTRETGFWTLVVKGGVNAQITVEADWGDSTGRSSKSFTLDGKQQIIYLNHEYQTAGSYRPEFTVIDDKSGEENDRSFRTKVEDGYYSNQTRVSISRIIPSDQSVGGTVMIDGSGFTRTGNTIYFGPGVIENVDSYNSGTMLFFNIPAYINPCARVNSGYCTAPVTMIEKGRYQMYVANSAGAASKITNIDVIQ